MTDGAPDFVTLEAAWWEWVNTNCPSKAKRERGKWMNANRFEFDGMKWERSSDGFKSNSGKTTVGRLTVFRAEDGRVVDNGGGSWTPNRRNDPKRNWGLGPD